MYVYELQCKMYSIKCTLYNVHCTLYNVHRVVRDIINIRLLLIIGNDSMLYYVSLVTNDMLYTIGTVCYILCIWKVLCAPMQF